MKPNTEQLSKILDQAKAAALAKSQAIWDRDEHQDCGSCGGAVLMLDARTKLAKLAVDKGIAWGSGNDIYVHTILADGVRSQNADIYQDSMREFRKVLIASGQEKAIKKFWTYID
jgi:hypothetical protein